VNHSCKEGRETPLKFLEGQGNKSLIIGADGEGKKKNINSGGGTELRGVGGGT